jgi:hypothetical protein
MVRAKKPMWPAAEYSVHLGSDAGTSDLVPVERSVRFL